MASGGEESSTLRAAEQAAATERSPMRAAPLTPGMIVAGKYEVQKLLGAGGMGAVYAARHTGLGHLVAIKVLQGDDIVEQDIGRFLREGRTAAKLTNEHAVRIYDIDVLPSELPFLVMEHLEGEDLGRVLLARQRLPIELAVTCIIQACEAIQEAHSLGVVHRDLKPHNLFLLRRKDDAPKIKVLDFGIAKIVKADVINASLAGTTDGALLGSPHFMSPEQIRSARSVDARTDIWSLGATLYKLLTGEPPFAASSVQRLLVEILSVEAPRVRAKRPEVGEALDEVVARCLAKSPDARFPSAEALASALRSAIAPRATGTSQASLADTLDDIPRKTMPMVPLARATPPLAPPPPAPLPTPAPPALGHAIAPAAEDPIATVVRPLPLLRIGAGLVFVGVLASIAAVAWGSCGGAPPPVASVMPSSSASSAVPLPARKPRPPECDRAKAAIARNSPAAAALEAKCRALGGAP